MARPSTKPTAATLVIPLKCDRGDTWDLVPSKGYERLAIALSELYVSGVANNMQRIFDLLLVSIAIALLFPILVSISVILRFTGEGEVLYKQSRVGRGCRPFGLYKFATMLKESPNIGAGEITVRNDPRVLPFGRFLRKTKINELPQLLNVLRGDMSLVGPRPVVPTTFTHYPEAAQKDIGRVSPGLSGVGSIIFRDEEAYFDAEDDPHTFFEEVIIPHKAELEQWYVRNRSLRLYFEVIFLTVWVIFFRQSKLPRRIWSSLPPPPAELVAHANPDNKDPE